LWTWLSGKPLTSPALTAVKLLFRLQRQGIGTPRLLAVGQREAGPWEVESFLLTAPPADTVPLLDWLAERSGDSRWTAERKQRRRVLRQAAIAVRRLHENGCFLAETRNAVRAEAAVAMRSAGGLLVSARSGG